MRSVTVLLALVGFGFAGCVADVSDVSGDTADTQSAILAKKLHYQQVDITAGPDGLDGWAPVGLSDKGEVLGQGFDCDANFVVCSFHLVKRQTDGTFTILVKNFAVNDVSQDGDTGGCTLDDASFGQAAIFSANGKLQLIPRLAGEITSCVNKVGNARIAVVDSFNATFEHTAYVFDGGRTTPFTLALASVEDVNNHAELAGIVSTPGANRAYRFDSRAAATTILPPVAPDPNSWGQGINRQGEVLGYSFVFDGVERIGKWNRKDQFEIAFLEGTPEFPTVSNRLVWNEDGTIVISATTDGNTYLVPEPGTRLNLADLVDGATVPSSLLALGINKGADILTTSQADGSTFLFLRTNN